MTEIITRRVQIIGRVQGVFFRAWTKEQADRLGLTGWVRNRKDGYVEALFSGPEAAVNEMLKLCEAGPANADVREIRQESAMGIAPARFEIKPTV